MKEINIGGAMPFGDYHWCILDIQNNAALIITENIAELRAYHDSPIDITWADCELRKYLNGEFYDKFSKNQKYWFQRKDENNSKRASKSEGCVW